MSLFICNAAKEMYVEIPRNNNAGMNRIIALNLHLRRTKTGPTQNKRMLDRAIWAMSPFEKYEYTEYAMFRVAMMFNTQKILIF